MDYTLVDTIDIPSAGITSLTVYDTKKDEDLIDFSLKLSNPSTIAQQQKLELFKYVRKLLFLIIWILLFIIIN